MNDVADRISTAAAYAGSTGAVIFGLTANELAAIIGAVVAVLTYFTNLWFKAQHLKIAKARAREDKVDGITS